MSFPPGTEMFQFPGFASPALCIQAGDTPKGVGFPIRTSADQRSLASPRGFSQRATSFIASWRQGIHRTPLSRSPSRHQPPARRTKPRRKQPNASTASHYAYHQYSYTSIPRFTCQRINPSENKSQPRGSLGSGPHGWEPEVPAEASPMSDRPEAAFAGHRERRAEPDDPAGSHCSGTLATRGHPPSASRTILERR